MKNDSTNLYNNMQEDSIDIIAALKKIWTKRKFISKVAVIFFIIGCVVAILSPVVYTSQTTFVPQVSDDQMGVNKSELGSLASLAGINLNTDSKAIDTYLSPLLYQKIADSEEFSLKLIDEQIRDLSGNKFSIKKYLQSERSFLNFNPISFIKKYSIDLFLNKKVDKNINFELYDKYNFINDEDFNLLNSFRNKFEIELNSKDGYVKVFATDENPFISSQIVSKVTKSLQSKIIEIRTKKISERLEFSKEQYELKQAEFNILQKKLAEFKDSNKSISTASFMSELQKLESEYQLQQSILINLASEYNNNKIKLNKDTPIFSVIDEVSVPNIRSKPRRKLLVIVYVFLGLVISVLYVIVKEPIINLIKEIIE